MIEIDKGVPFQDGRRSGRKPKYPWAKMEVGDSFGVQGVSANSMRVTARYHKQRTGRDFRVAEAAGQVRVWRVA